MINLNFQTLVNLINEDILLENKMHSILKDYPGGDKLFRAMAEFHYIDSKDTFEECDIEDFFADDEFFHPAVLIVIGVMGCAALEVDVDPSRYEEDDKYLYCNILTVTDEGEEKLRETSIEFPDAERFIKKTIGPIEECYCCYNSGGDYARTLNRKREKLKVPMERKEIVNRLYFKVRPILKNNLEPVVTRFESRAKRFLDAGNFSEVQVILHACKKINTMISDLSSEDLKQIPESYRKAFDVAMDEYCQDQGEGLTSQEKNKILEKLLSAGPELKEFLDILRPTLFRYKDIL